jgi:hypothetical protein
MAEHESRPGIAYGEDVLGELLLLLTDFNESCNEQAHPGVIDALYRYLDAQSALLPEQNRSGRRPPPSPGSQDLFSSLPPAHTGPQATQPSPATSEPQVDAAAQPVMTELSVESLNANSYLHVIASPADCRERERRSDEKNTVNAVRRSHWSSIIP